ncbi:hypothetical protein ACG7TL_002235 [Trametes sanguinea]
MGKNGLKVECVFCGAFAGGSAQMHAAGGSVPEKTFSRKGSEVPGIVPEKDLRFLAEGTKGEGAARPDGEQDHASGSHEDEERWNGLGRADRASTASAPHRGTPRAAAHQLRRPCCTPAEQVPSLLRATSMRARSGARGLQTIPARGPLARTDRDSARELSAGIAVTHLVSSLPPAGGLRDQLAGKRRTTNARHSPVAVDVWEK